MKKILTGAVLAFALLIPTFSFAQAVPLTDQFETDTVENECVDLKFNLSHRSRDARTNGEVSVLQNFLIDEGYLSGKSTGFFGVATRVAVQKFQSEVGISSTGRVGPKTRAEIKKMTCGGGTTTIPTRIEVGEVRKETPKVVTPTTSTVSGCATGAVYNTTTGQKCMVTTTAVPRSGSLAVSVSATPTSSTIVAGSQGVTFTNYIFDATQSNESVRFSSLPLNVFGTGGMHNLSTCQLYDGSIALNTGLNVINPVDNSFQQFVFNNPIIIQQGMIKTLSLKCNVSSAVSFGKTFGWGMTDNLVASRLNAVGVSSGQSIVPVINYSDNQIQFMTVGVVAAPSIRVVSPNGGENLEVGKTYNITWQPIDIGNASVYLLSSNGLSCFLKTVPSTAGSAAVEVSVKNCDNSGWSSVSPGQYKISITHDIDGVWKSNDRSDGFFTVTTQFTSAVLITVISPKFGDNWEIGKIYSVQWNVSDALMGRYVHLVKNYVKGMPASGGYLYTLGSQLDYTVPQTTPTGVYSLIVCGAYCEGIASDPVLINIVNPI